jgi:hypothetical protein
LQAKEQAHTKDVLQFEERKGSDTTALGGGTSVTVQAPNTVHEASKVAGVALATSHEAYLANVLACYCPCGRGSTMTLESAAVKQAEALFVKAASVSTEVRLRSPSLAADASVVGDMSEDHRAVGAEVKTETGPGTVDMKEMEAIAEALIISITWHSAVGWELQELPLTLSNQTHQPSVTSPSAPVDSNHLMKKGKKILNSGATIKFTTSLKESSPKANRTEISVQKSINCINCQTNLYKKTGFWGNEVSSIEKRVNCNFISQRTPACGRSTMREKSSNC